ncbi:MAG: methyltransferase domain-containing protein [Candidatus Omnitrophota bacterium]
MYIDQKKILGIDITDKNEKEKIWSSYVEAFKKGAYNFIKEEYDPVAREIIPRKYFSGGALLVLPEIDTAKKPGKPFRNSSLVQFQGEPDVSNAQIPQKDDSSKIEKVKSLYPDYPSETTSQNDDHWTESAKSFAEKKKGDPVPVKFYKAVLEQLSPESQILDVATGDGSFLSYVMRTFKNFFGFDISAGVLERAIKINKIPQEKLQQGNIKDVDLGKDKWDVIMASDVLLYLSPEELAKVMKKFHDALTKDGKLAIRWNAGDNKYIAKQDGRGAVYVDEHFLKTLLPLFGFEVESINKEPVEIYAAQTKKEGRKKIYMDYWYVIAKKGSVEKKDYPVAHTVASLEGPNYATIHNYTIDPDSVKIKIITQPDVVSRDFIERPVEPDKLDGLGKTIDQVVGSSPDKESILLAFNGVQGNFWTADSGVIVDGRLIIKPAGVRAIFQKDGHVPLNGDYWVFSLDQNDRGIYKVRVTNGNLPDDFHVRNGLLGPPLMENGESMINQIQFNQRPESAGNHVNWPRDQRMSMSAIGYTKEGKLVYLALVGDPNDLTRQGPQIDDLVSEFKKQGVLMRYYWVVAWMFRHITKMRMVRK